VKHTYNSARVSFRSMFLYEKRYCNLKYPLDLSFYCLFRFIDNII